MTDTLWQSFANCNSASLEAEALDAAIVQAVAEGGLGAIRAGDDKWDYDSWCDEAEWITSYTIQSMGLREVGVVGRARRTLSIAVSFYRAEDRHGDDWVGGRRAKIYVGVAPSFKAWEADSLLVDGSGRSPGATPISPFRWARHGNAQAWFFCVALDAIDSREALGIEVFGPLRALLGGADEKTAFAGCKSIIGPPEAN